ncbi:type I pantothenate kinase [Aquihabitans daechungensis]|uniref:type I pantothenate kinase n=1 Tax=Aquihabitans daechungensis TaxID=1052257 RepID=UPI003BA0A527
MNSALYETFTRDQWRARRAATPLTLDADDLDELRGLNEALDLDEVESVYLPLSRLVNLHVAAVRGRQDATQVFLDRAQDRVPYVIGVAGSVAVGKSTTARVLRALLARWPDHPRVDLVTTDGFLYPNAVLEQRGLLGRKGFPESYDVRRLLEFLRGVKSGSEEMRAPTYSHLTYDVLPPEHDIVVRTPDILIVEGLNVLQVSRGTTTFVSDFFDLSIYVDAEVEDVRRWYIERFHTLRRTVFTRPDSYFQRYAELSDDEATETALQIWKDINERNLVANIEPTRDRADVILRKGPDHHVDEVRLRRI